MTMEVYKKNVILVFAHHNNSLIPACFGRYLYFCLHIHLQNETGNIYHSFATTVSQHKCHNKTVTTQQCHNTTVSQHNSVTTQQCHNTTVSQHNTVTTQNL